jgi:serine/threonine-protein kinase
MSPEQAEGKTASVRSDLYSLGSILYASLAGKAPFAGKSVPETLYALKFTDPIPIRRIAKDTPIELAELVEQLLAKDPNNRPPTALVVGNRMKAMKQGLKKKSETQLGSDIATYETHTSLDLNDFRERLIDLPKNTSDRLTLDAANPSLSQPTDPTLLARPQTDLALGANVSDHPSDFHSSIDDVHSDSHSRETHFTVVEHETGIKKNSAEANLAEPDPKSNLLSIVVIVGGLLVCILGVTYALLPPSADEVYQEISSAIESQDEKKLAQAYDEILFFLDSFPNDERIEIVKGTKNEIEASRLLKKLDDRSLVNIDSTDGVLDFSIANAVKMSESDPANAIQQLKLIQNIYETSAELSVSQEQQLEAIRLLRRKLETQIADKEIAFQKELLELVLSEDQALRGEKKSQFMRSIVELYKDYGWASPAVEHAKKVLSTAENTPSK